MAAVNGETRRQHTENDYTDFAHTGPGTLAGRYLRMFWQPVYGAEDLPPGRSVPIRLMSEDFTLYRGEGGAPHLLAFRCAHRGTQLSTGWVEGDDLRCFYHGWKYDPSGQCIEQPAEPEPFCQKIKIRSYPAQEYLGLVFTYLGEGAPPPIPRYPGMEQDGVLEVHSLVRACNYFNNIENDASHNLFAHSRGRSRPMTRESARETEWGLEERSTYPNGVSRIKQWGMPNITHLKSPPDSASSGWRDTMSWRLPIDDESMVDFGLQFIHLTGEEARAYTERRAGWFADGGQHHPPELVSAILAGELRIQDLYDRTDLEFAQIEHSICQIGQGVIPDRGNENLGATDVAVILVRRLWERELRALAEGRPLSQWAHTDGLAVTDNLPHHVAGA